MLSVLSPEKAPFFSDELFRWAFFELGKGKGWDRPIKYTAKEYAELYEKAQELLERLRVNAVDAEKVAFVLGKGALPGKSAKNEGVQKPKHKAGEDPPVAAKGKRPKHSSSQDESTLPDKTTATCMTDDKSLRRSKRQRTK